VDQEAQGWPDSRRQEPPWIGDTTVELEAVEPSDPVTFGNRLIGEPTAADLRAGRSLLATTCPFFRRETADGTLGRPIEMPEPINRCAAYGEPRPQSLRQQELVCLSSRHVDCPRYLRAAAAAPRSTRRSAPGARQLSRAILVAVAILVLSATASFAFVLARGGLALRIGAGTTGAVEAATGKPGPTADAVAPSASPAPSASGPDATASAAPEATPAVTPAPAASDERYALLQPCPDKPDCYVYKVRRGDTLTGIAKFFGTTLATVRELNPWTKTKGIQAGQKLTLPPPPA
jgi:LysM repeat protein